MIYRDFKGDRLSTLGYGMMRLPVLDGDGAKIDEDAARELIAYAMKNGINYYDTAWGYHGGNSELVTGKLLSEYPRDSYYLATKFPGFDTSLMSKAEEIFEKQLEKCRVDYFDYYLFHSVSDGSIDMYLDPKYGVFDYLVKQKKNGRIRHLGFSAHTSYDNFKRFLDAYGSELEFCQLQINYLDWTYQHADEKVKLLNERGLGVWIMEPLRGGRLAKLDAAYEAALKNIRPDESVTSMAFRFTQSLPNVYVTLSGMTTMEQLQQNVAVFENEKPLNAKEAEKLTNVTADMLASTVPCTGCRYCVSGCPAALDIPRLLGIYNEASLVKDGFHNDWHFRHIDENKRPDACVGCKSCEAVCPQGIGISDIMRKFAENMK